jgi:hypothetical protein
MDDQPRPPIISVGAIGSLLLLVGLLYGASWILRAVGTRYVHPLAAVLALPAVIAVGVVILLVIVFSASAMRRRRSLDRERRGLCTACGYDLRGTRHEHCPECGILILRRRDPVTGKELD